MNKVVANATEAIAGIQDGMTLMLGGFGLCGIPENGIAALVASGVKGLTCISNNAGVDDFGIGLMLQQRQVKKMISSYVGENAEFERQLLSGELEVDPHPARLPGRTLSRRRRGHSRLFHPGRLRHRSGEGKEVREFDGKPYLLESALTADFALVKAWKGDTHGNLIYKGTARNFNPMMASAGKITIAEVEELVPAGRTAGPQSDPYTGHLRSTHFPRAADYEKRIEQLTVRQKA